MSAKNTAIGRVYEIGPVEAVGQNGHKKRKIIIVSHRKTQDSERDEYLAVDFWNDKALSLDQFAPNQLVQIEYFSSSRYWQPSNTWFNDNTGYTIQKYVAPNYGQQPQQTQAVNPAPQQVPGGDPYRTGMQQRHSPDMFYSQPAPNPYGTQPTAPMPQRPAGDDFLF